MFIPDVIEGHSVSLLRVSSPPARWFLIRSLFALVVAAMTLPACAADTSGPGVDDDGADTDDGNADKGDDTDSPGGDDDGDAPGDDGDGDGDATGDDGDGDGDGDDASGVDATTPLVDAAPPDAGPPPPEGPYQLLSESGLYSDIVNKVLRPDVTEFEPEFKLWSDGAAKRRWIYLPAGTQINTARMDRWVVLPGTTVWKEFSDPITGKRLETRIIQRLADGQFYFASFIWNEDDTEAVFDDTASNEPAVDIPAGCSTCADPPCETYPADCHVVPRSTECVQCHGGESSRLLGFSAVQLSHDGPGLTLSDLADLDLMSDPPPGGQTFAVPGTPIERNAIGYLHANCGHCHSPASGQNGCESLTGFQARVLPDDVGSVETTSVYETGVGQPLVFWLGEVRGNFTDITDRIVPGDPQGSAVWYRMSVREFGQLEPLNDHQQMPFSFTNEVDEDGLAAVELWINSLP
jgi:hypothetical protein